MYHGTIIQIDDCLVSEEILTEYFSCDYEKCKGCCCVIGDSGAPMEECEAGAIEKNYGIFSPLMREEGRAAVAAKGFFEIDCDGDMVTPLVPGSEECAYTMFDEAGNCFCSMERCWFQGKGDFMLALPYKDNPAQQRDKGLEPAPVGNMQGRFRKRQKRKGPRI